MSRYNISLCDTNVTSQSGNSIKCHSSIFDSNILEVLGMKSEEITTTSASSIESTVPLTSHSDTKGNTESTSSHKYSYSSYTNKHKYSSYNSVTTSPTPSPLDTQTIISPSNATSTDGDNSMSKENVMPRRMLSSRRRLGQIYTPEEESSLPEARWNLPDNEDTRDDDAFSQWYLKSSLDFDNDGNATSFYPILK
jgi:hypothetical protein